MRKHSSYGFKITAIDFISYLTRESMNLILSKGAGPAFLGFFRKSNSLSRLPNWVIVRATMDPVFRAMSMVQDDLDQSKYIFYRTITLFMAYTTPLYVLMWWVAEPFIGFVYGEKWLPVAAPLQILLCAGLFFNVLHPSNRLLNAQNRLTQRLLAQIASLAVIVGACVVGLKWGLVGVAWGILGSHVFSTSYSYFLVYRTIPTRFTELVRAAAPGLTLSGLLFIVLLVLNALLGDTRTERPALYLLIMTISGSIFYVSAFLVLPISSLRSEAYRWRQKFNGGLSFLYKAFK
jgi:O-antigen/teichoic acid export membrane protein